jgi:hypothetical protein
MRVSGNYFTLYQLFGCLFSRLHICRPVNDVAATLLPEVTFGYVPGSELSWGFTMRK